MTTKTGAELIADERRRQIEVEGFGPDNDARYKSKKLATAAYCYLYLYLGLNNVETLIRTLWSFHLNWWKPTTDVRNLVKAGALIAAEIDRIQNDNTSSIPPS